MAPTWQLWFEKVRRSTPDKLTTGQQITTKPPTSALQQYSIMLNNGSPDKQTGCHTLPEADTALPPLRDVLMDSSLSWVTKVTDSCPCGRLSSRHR